MTSQHKVDFLIECAKAKDTQRALTTIGNDLCLLIDTISYCISQGGRNKRLAKWLRETYSNHRTELRKNGPNSRISRTNSPKNNRI